MSTNSDAGAAEQPTIAAIPPSSENSNNNEPPDTSNDAALAASLAAQEEASFGAVASSTPHAFPSKVGASADDEDTVNTTPPPPDTSNDAALAASLAAAEEQQASPSGATATTPITPAGLPEYSVATASAAWQYDELQTACTDCGEHFHAFNRRHHCRYCGRIFCHDCSNQRALIPPSSIVLHPAGGKKARPGDGHSVSFSPDPDPDRMLTYMATATGEPSSSSSAAPEQLLYGKGLEERFQLAREPIRVCRNCHRQLQPVQEELRRQNSHSVRYNYIDPSDPKRLFNSPLAFTLGHEIRKAAYTLNNLLPQPKRRTGALVEYNSDNNDSSSVMRAELQQCRDTCAGVSPNLGDLDGVRIPAVLLERAKGVAVLTVIKGGFGLAGVEFGTGLVVARLPGDSTNTGGNSYRWSAPSAIGTAGLSWGALIGAQVSDHVFLLMTDAAVAVMFSNNASVQLGADVGVAVGPVGRAVEGDWGADGQAAAPIYTYSLSKGLYAGISLDGKVIVARPNVNEKFYGCPVTAQEILAGAVPTPPAAQPLYEALQRCHVYASAAAGTTPNRHLMSTSSSSSRPMPPMQESPSLLNEYGELQPDVRLPYSPMAAAAAAGGDHQSHGAISDITSDL